MKEIATLQFPDQATNGTSLVIISVHEGRVFLSLSLESDGDVEVGLTPEDCQAVVNALQRALVISKEQK